MSDNNQELIVRNCLGAEAAKLFSILINQEPQKADAIILLQGDRLDRVKKVQSLYENKFAEHIVITGNNELIGRGKRNEENDIHLSKLKNYFLSHKIPEESIVVDDMALNTLEQAVNTIKLAKEKNWSKLLIITSPYHLLRAHLTFIKESTNQDWEGIIIIHAAGLGWEEIPSGRKKTNFKMLAIEAEKIKKYKEDIATIEEGIKYISKNL